MQEKPTNTETDQESQKKQFHFSYKENKEEHTLLFSGDIKRVKLRRINYAKIISIYICTYIHVCRKKKRMKMKSNVHPTIEKVNDNVARRS